MRSPYAACAVGEPVLLTDGAGHVAECEVTATGKARLDVVVRSVSSVPAPTPEVVVVQALPKGDRGELAVEVLTEIGVARIVPWAAARSVAVWRGDRAAKSLARWQATAREAAKQARRAWFPEVTPLASTDEVAALIAGAPLALVLHEEATEPLPAERAGPGGPGRRPRGRAGAGGARGVHRRRRSYASGSAPRCSARPPPASPPSPRCSRAPPRWR